MILSSGMAMPMKNPVLKVKRRINGLPAALASMKSGVRIETEQLRKQIDQLNHEAEITRSKANNARERLMRLSQAAENLQQRAVLDVALNKENEARELLMQKKKLIKALEKTKSRLEVLDELSVKINEAISLKETRLIGNVSLFPEIVLEDTSPEIRIISPKNNYDKDTIKTENSEMHHGKLCNEHDVDTVKHESGLSLNHEQDIIIDDRASDNMLNDLRALSSYEDFLEDVDEQLMQIELDIYNFLRFSTMVLESKQKQMNTKVQQASEILGHIRKTRGRIASITERRENES